MTIQVREAVVDAEPAEWLAEVGSGLTAAERTLVAQAFALASECYAARQCRDGEPLLGHCREVATILCDLHMEGESLAAALLSAMPDVVTGWPELVSERVSAPVAALVEGVARMAQIQGLRAKVEGGSRPAERAAQLEALRKMLLAMVQDARVVLIKLADQTQTLRYLAGRGEPAARMAAARDTLDLFSPLANRLGVWQLKWELEDLALRCSEPDTYKAIARELHEKRPEREAYIAEVAQRLKSELAAAGVRAEVVGRPKHIYSIYSKLKRKDLTLKELFDVRGVRVLVDDVKDCYAALGLVHNLWTPLPKEFDDYIAKPKPNNYRSLHTAVVGPDGKVLEVQIRTHEMHQHNEYGVAAHWRYKEAGSSRGDEGARARGESRRSAASFDERIGWLRQILDWRDGLADVADLAEYFRTGLFEDTVYVLTPQGRVIDLPQGATPVDFAYHVHTRPGPSLPRCARGRRDGAAELPPGQRADGRDRRRQERRSEPGLAQSRAGLHPQLAGARQGPPVVQHPEPGSRHRPGPADRGARAAARRHDRARPGQARRSAALRQGRRAARGGRPQRADGTPGADRLAGACAGARRRTGAAAGQAGGAASQGRHPGGGRRQAADGAGPLLQAGTARSHHRLRDPRPRRHGASRRPAPTSRAWWPSA